MLISLHIDYWLHNNRFVFIYYSSCPLSPVWVALNVSPIIVVHIVLYYDRAAWTLYNAYRDRVTRTFGSNSCRKLDLLHLLCVLFSIYFMPYWTYHLRPYETTSIPRTWVETSNNNNRKNLFLFNLIEWKCYEIAWPIRMSVIAIPTYWSSSKLFL